MDGHFRMAGNTNLGLLTPIKGVRTGWRQACRRTPLPQAIDYATKVSPRQGAVGRPTCLNWITQPCSTPALGQIPQCLVGRNPAPPAPLDELGHVDPAATRLDPGHPPLRLPNLGGQLALRQARAFAHLGQEGGHPAVNQCMVWLRGHATTIWRNCLDALCASGDNNCSAASHSITSRAAGQPHLRPSAPGHG